MKEKVAGVSILANIGLASGKITVGVISNSTAILAAGMDSFVDIFSSAISYLGIKISNKPPDKEHPYGHYKFEVLGGVIITIIILLTGVGIIYKSYQSFLEPENVEISYLAFGVMIFSVVINETMARLKIYYGKKENSVSLLSDGTHSRIDAYTSLAILVGLVFTRYWIYVDALLALLMGIYIIKEAFFIGKEAISSLLDVSAGEKVENKMKSIAQNKNIEVSSLKTQKKGSVITANLEIKLKSDLKVEEATKLSNNLREDLMKGIDGLKYVAIQIRSLEMETSFYQPDFGKGFSWQKQGKGSGGSCICEKCGYKTDHKRGVPCSGLKCPNCKIDLKRE